MNRAVVAIVVVGLAMAVATGFNLGFDSTAVVYLGLMVAVGALAIGVATRAKRGTTGPARCPDCGGLVSPNAPFCKHCNATLEAPKL